jgi:DNA-binding CsgD family transcriptional regulator
MLSGLNELLHSVAGAAFILRLGEAGGAAGMPVLVSLFDVGFRSDEQRQVFLREFNTAPFRDPFSRAAIEKFAGQRSPTLTFRRSELIDDRAWQADRHVQEYRRPMGTGDCLFSLHRGTDRHLAYAILLFKPAPCMVAEGRPGPGTALHAAARFSGRDRVLLDTLQRGLDWLYRIEETAHAKLNRASALPPRLRQTLEFLLAGETERQVAQKMSLSVHTVHDYVKALYTHFGVSSRNELLTKWMQTSGQLPPRKKGAGQEESEDKI